MSFFPNDIVKEIEDVARISFMGKGDVKLWNENRRGAELRLLTGYAWTSKDGSQYGQGYRSYSAACRAAYYALVVQKAAPGLAGKKARLKVVA
jgi:hypothetical protein